VNASKSFSRVFVIIDALDECDSAQRVTLLRILTEFGPSIRVLVTSRPEPDIEGVLESYPKIIPSAGDINADVRAYISTLIQRTQVSAILDRDIKSPEVREQARKELVEMLYRSSCGL
jgi:hypothetical protein